MSEDPTSAVSIEVEDLETEFVKLPGDLARWNELYANAVGEHLDAKFNLERVRAKLYGAFRKPDENGKKRTEKEIEASIDRHSQTRLAQDKLVEATKEKARLYGIVDAIRTKKDSLVSIGAQRRAEMNPPKIKHSAQDDDSDDLDDSDDGA